MTIEERFEKIEKENQALKDQTQALKDQARKLRRLAWGAVAIALAAFVGGTAMWVSAADGTFDTVYAKTIHLDTVFAKNIYLKDSSSRLRLHLAGATGVVNVLEESGRIRVFLSQGGFYFNDPNGVSRMIMTSLDGKASFLNASGQLVAAIDSTGLSAQAVTLKDGANLTRLILNGPQGYFALADSNGRQRANISNAGVALSDANGKWRASLDSDGRLKVNDPNGATRVLISGSEAKVYILTAAGAFVKTLP